MDRRGFLAALGGGIAASAVAGSAKARPTGNAALISTYVTNVADRGARPLPQPGTRLHLKLDGVMHCDQRSVVVSTADGDALGHLPSVHARTVEALMAAGTPMRVSVVESKTMPRPALRIEIRPQPVKVRTTA